MKFKTEISAGGIVFKIVKLPTSNLQHVLWLITQHSQHKGWGFPKGLIGDKDKNEPIEQAALREVEEEGGIKAKIVLDKPVKVIYNYRLKDFLVDKTVYYFLMEYISGNPKNHDWEVSEAKFLNEDEIKKILTYKSDKEAFEQAIKLLESRKNL